MSAIKVQLIEPKLVNIKLRIQKGVIIYKY